MGRYELLDRELERLNQYGKKDLIDEKTFNKIREIKETIKNTKGIKPGDVVEMTDECGTYFEAATIESIDECGIAHVCLTGGSVHVSAGVTEQEKYYCLSISGGPWKHIDTNFLRFSDIADTQAWTWGKNGACANGGVYFNMPVNKYTLEQKDKNLFTTKDYDHEYVTDYMNPREKYRFSSNRAEAFENKEEFLAYLQTFNGKVYEHHGYGKMKTFSVWTYKEKRIYVTKDIFEHKTALAHCYDDTILCNGIRPAKRYKNDEEKTVYTYVCSDSEELDYNTHYCYKHARDLKNNEYLQENCKLILDLRESDYLDNRNRIVKGKTDLLIVGDNIRDLMLTLKNKFIKTMFKEIYPNLKNFSKKKSFRINLKKENYGVFDTIEEQLEFLLSYLRYFEMKNYQYLDSGLIVEDSKIKIAIVANKKEEKQWEEEISVLI